MNFTSILLLCCLSAITALQQGQAVSRDGNLTRFIESVPVAGMGASAVHAIAGNREHARRAAVKNYASTTTTAAAAAGGALGGPAGAALAGGAVGAGMHNLEAKIGKHIDAPGMATHDSREYAAAAGFGALGGFMGGKAGAAGANEFGKQAAGHFGGKIPGHLAKQDIKKNGRRLRHVITL